MTYEEAIEAHPVFEVLERTGKRYALYADGRIEGFGADVAIINRYPAFVDYWRARLMAPGTPTQSDNSDFDGRSTSSAEYAASNGAATSAAAGEK